jgi:prepilin-type N-terminal cleavage/methylation domain-containing protein
VNRARFYNSGFSIIELSLVLIIFGILAAAIVPLAQSGHEDSLRRQDMNTMETARDALLGYLRVNEGIPCVDATGVQVSTGCDATETLDILGVRSTDSRRMSFAYDVNETLTLADLSTNGTGVCAALANIIDPPIPPVTPVEPALCDSANANTGNAACTATHPMAMVLVGRGSDRCLNLENSHGNAANDGVCPTAVTNNRTFENPARIQSKTMDDGYYDDLVLTVSPTELAEALDCPTGGGGGTGPGLCLAGESLVQVINGINNSVGISIDGACYTVDRGTTAALGCQVDSTAIGVFGNTSCSTLYFGGTVGILDTNTDGRVDIICNSTNCNSR